ncbi:MAG: adenylate/guanylate cyclase domain-containing protein [Geitlerinemataceae cyanobacterium]
MWAKLKQQIWQWRGVVVAAPSAAGLVLLLRWIGLLQGTELWAFDQLVRWRPQEAQDDRIVIVGISEKDLQTYNFPISDRLLAQALNSIKQQEPRAIGLDIYRDLPVPPDYESLAKTFREQPALLEKEIPIEPGYQSLLDIFQTTPNLIGIERAIGDESFGKVAPPPKLKELGQVASNDFPRDTDLKIRRGFLYLTNPDSGELIFSLAFKLAMIYLQQDGIEPEMTDTEQVKLKTAVFPPLKIDEAGKTNDGGYIRTEGAGYQVLVNYRGPKESFPIVELGEVLEGTIPANFFRDRIVLIGSTAASLNDYFDTPYSSTTIAASEQTSGVEIHANLTSQILSATLDGRTLLQVWPDPVEWLWILAASSVGAIVSWRWRYARGIVKFLPQIVVAMALLGISYLAFLGGWWIPFVPPVLALAGASVAITAYVARTAGDIRKTFSRYLTDEVVATLLETPEGLKMGGERRKITILTSDLRGFTSLSERLPPEQVVSILNIYLESMADAITSYQGTIDEFMGDGILVLFGAPTQRHDDPERAVACALAMQKAMPKVNQDIQTLNLPFELQLQMGIGINTGEVVVGNIGSLKRTKYGIVGAQVNLTYRIEGYTVGGQILVTESTLNPVKDMVNIDHTRTVSPKGVSEPIPIYSIVGIGGKHDLELHREEEVLVALQKAIPVTFTIVEGKDVGDGVLEGSLLELSERSGELRSPISLELLSNLKVKIVTADDFGTSEGELYAKVIKKSPKNETDFRLSLTSVPPEVDTFLKQKYKSGGV